jgi:hypothetical protein
MNLRFFYFRFFPWRIVCFVSYFVALYGLQLFLTVKLETMIIIWFCWILSSCILMKLFLLLSNISETTWNLYFVYLIMTGKLRVVHFVGPIWVAHVMTFTRSYLMFQFTPHKEILNSPCTYANYTYMRVSNYVGIISVKPVTRNYTMGVSNVGETLRLFLVITSIILHRFPCSIHLSPFHSKLFCLSY